VKKVAQKRKKQYDAQSPHADWQAPQSAGKGKWLSATVKNDIFCFLFGYSEK